MNVDYADAIVLLASTPAQAKSQLHGQQVALASMSMQTKTEYMCFNQYQRGDISILNGGSLKLLDKFNYLRSSVSSTENNVNTWFVKAKSTINRLLVIWKSDLSDKIKHNFFQAAVVSILLYGCPTWMLTKCKEKTLNVNCTRMLWAILNKSSKQHPTKQQLYRHLPLISKTIQIRQTRHPGMLEE